MSRQQGDELYDTGAALVFLRNQFYTMTYHRLMLTLMVSIIFNVVMITITIWLLREKISPIYFPTDPKGRLLDEKPLNQPLLSEKEIKAFAIKAAQTVTSFDYLNYRRDLQLGRKYFTDNGFDIYIEALDKSRNLETVKQESLVSKGELAGDPKIRNAFLSGRYVWYIDVPMNIRYQSQTIKIVQPVIIHILAGRVPTTQSLYGVQIAQIWIEDRMEPKSR